MNEKKKRFSVYKRKKKSNYDVPQLIEVTTNFITENFDDLLFKIKLQFISANLNNDFDKLKELLCDTTTEENKIASNINKFIENKEILNLHILIIDRILQKSFQHNYEKERSKCY